MNTITRFVILSYPRCGTHLLRTALDTHNNITMRGEYYGNIRKFQAGHKEINFLDTYSLYHQAFKPMNDEITASGFVLHRIRHDDVIFLEYLMNDKNVKIIYLGRDNLLRRFISEKISMITSKWRYHKSLNEDNIQLPSINFDNIEFIKNVNLYNERNEFFLRKFKYHNMYKTTYENIINQYDEELYSIQQFINVQPLKLDVDVNKVVTEPLKNIVSNYDEMIEFLINTNMETYIPINVENII